MFKVPEISIYRIHQCCLKIAWQNDALLVNYTLVCRMILPFFSRESLLKYIKIRRNFSKLGISNFFITAVLGVIEKSNKKIQLSHPFYRNMNEPASSPLGPGVEGMQGRTMKVSLDLESTRKGKLNQQLTSTVTMVPIKIKVRASLKNFLPELSSVLDIDNEITEYRWGSTSGGAKNACKVHTQEQHSAFRKDQYTYTRSERHIFVVIPDYTPIWVRVGWHRFRAFLRIT